MIREIFNKRYNNCETFKERYSGGIVETIDAKCSIHLKYYHDWIGIKCLLSFERKLSPESLFLFYDINDFSRNFIYVCTKSYDFARLRQDCKHKRE